MKKFLIRTLVFFAPILLFAGLTEYLLRHIPNDYAYKSNHLDKHSNEVEALVLGNSHAFFDLNPQFFTCKGFNAAYASQSYDYDWKIFQKYEQKWNSLQFIIIPVDYLSLFSPLENTIENWRVKNYSIYYNIKTNTEPLDNFEILKSLPSNFNRIQRYYVNNINDLICDSFGWGTIYQAKLQRNLTESSIAAAKRHTTDTYAHYEMLLGDLKNIITFAAKRNIRVLLVTCPAYKTYISSLQPGQWEKASNTVQLLTRLYPNTTYYNFMRDTTFTDADFWDGDHLNDLGAKKFTLKVDSIMSTIKRVY